MTGAPDPERVRALLDARASALASRGDARRDRVEADATRAYLVCACGDERVGMPLEACAGVFPARACTPVPEGPAWLRGIIAVSGGIVSVVDLARLLRLPGERRASAAGDGPGHFVRLRAADPPVALAVDRVLGVSEIAEAPVDLDGIGASSGTRAPLGTGAVSGYAPPASGAGDGFTILDLPRLMRELAS